MTPTPTRIAVPTIDELVVFILRLHAALFCVGMLIAVPCAILWLGFQAMNG